MLDENFEVNIKKILAQTLLHVTKMLWTKNTDKIDNKKKDVLAYLYSNEMPTKDNIYVINQLNNELVLFDKISSYESFQSKLNLISNIIEVCAQICRITNIVPVKNSISKKEEEGGNETEDDE